MSQTHWTNYYRSGALVTGPRGAQAGYDRELAEAWVHMFQVLPQTSTILDIGTGNGAIVAMANAWAQQHSSDWAIHGADLADINPAHDVPNGERLFSGCHFHPKTPAERLPFEPDTFDLVCGHFALEYTEVPKTLAEVARVLKPGAQARFIIHHSDSVLVANAEQSLAETDLIIESAGIYARLRELIQDSGPLPPIDTPEAQALSTAIDTLRAARIHDKPATSSVVVSACLDAAKHILYLRSQGADPEPALAALSQAQDDLRHSAQRLRDLLAVGHNERQIKALLNTGEDAGLVARGFRPLYHQRTNLVGWVVDFISD